MNHRSGLGFWLAGWIVLLVAAVTPFAACAQADPVAAVTARPAEYGPVGTAMSLVLKGRFDQALAEIKSRAQADSTDPALRQAAADLETFVSRYKEHEAHKAKEYAEAVERAKRALLAMRSFEDLEAAGLLEPLRKAVMEGVGDAQGGASTSVALERAQLADVEQMRRDTLKALDDSAEALTSAGELVTDLDSEYGREFRRLTEAYAEKLSAHRAAWEAVRPGDVEEKDALAERLEDSEQQLSEALGELESMVTKDTWRIALGQARLAKALAGHGKDLSGEAWLEDVVAETDRIGIEAGEDGRWYDALAAYAGLEELLPDSEEFDRKEKLARLHARVLRLYGGEEDEETNDEWKEYVKDIDVRMVESAIRAISRAYVTSVDYRKLVHGGIRAVRVLAETEQAAKSFPGLEDEPERVAFLSKLDKILGDYERKNNLSSLDLHLAQNSVLLAAQQTVDLPTAVVAREFCDGVIGELDKFSGMTWPSDYEEFRKSIMGKYGGVGIQITKEPGEPLRVVTPLHGSPAFEAGIKAGDLIVQVDGEPTRDRDLEELVKMISGPQGTKVTLTLKRPGVIKEFDVTVRRAEIVLKTVKGWKRINERGDWQYLLDGDQRVGYIRVTQFTGETHDELVEAIKQIKQSGSGSLILDLRYNPGGWLPSAHEVSNEFISGGLVVSTKGAKQLEDRREADAGGAFLEGDVVVLVNDMTASAAEIVSGALQHWKRCWVVGTRTYGKGSVQNVIRIRFDKARLRLTTAYYYLPSNKLIHRTEGAKEWGVDPDVRIDMTPKETRDWLGLQGKTDLIVDTNEKLDRQLAEQFDADLQLQTAMLMLKLERLIDRTRAVQAARSEASEAK